MGVKAKLKIKADAVILNARITKENLFLGVPPKFKILKVAALAIVDPIINSIKQQILALLGSLSLEMLLSLGLGFLFAQLNKKNSDDVNGDGGSETLGNDIVISDQDLLDSVKKNPDLAAINRFIAKDFDKRMADELSVACANEDFSNDIIKQLEGALGEKDFNGDDFINIVKSNSDFENVTDESVNLTGVTEKNNPENALANLLDKFGSILAILLLLFSIFMLVREYIASNRYPSQFRGRILGGIIQSITGLIKSIINKAVDTVNSAKDAAVNAKDAVINTANSAKDTAVDTANSAKDTAVNAKDSLASAPTSIKNAAKGLKIDKDAAKKLLPMLNIMNAIIIALGAAALIYLNNRKKGQELAFETLDIVSAESCVILPTAREITDDSNNGVLESINGFGQAIPFSYDGFPCPIDITNIPIVPHMPFEEKLLDDFCDVDLDLFDELIDDGNGINTAGDAIFENLSDFVFTKKVRKNQTIIPNQSIGTIGEDIIYAPVGGKIIKIEENKIWLTDIVDGGFAPIHEESEVLKSKYVEITDIKEFIREFYGKSQYPSIVSSAKDPEFTIPPTSITNSGPIVVYNDLIEETTIIKEIYETNIKILGGEDNVKTQSENENLIGLQKSIEDEEDLLFLNLKNAVGEANALAIQIAAIEGNYILIDWYFQLKEDLGNFYNPNNTIIIDFQRKLNSLLLDRFFIEEHNIPEIKLLINELLNDLDISLTIKEFIPTLNNIWTQNIGSDAIKSIKVYVDRVGESNTNISKTDKARLASRITSLYVFIKDAEDVLSETNEYIPEGDKVTRAATEKNFIDNYFNDLFKRINEINLEIKNATKILQDMGSSAVPPAIRNIDGIDYEWYGLKGRDRTCNIPEVEDPYLSPYTTDDYNQYRYWLKYCAFATLFSIIPSIVGRAKGFPTPPPGIPFPVIYIPFFGMMTKWGIFAVGLTITGIFPFPWLLFVNFSTDYNTPLGDPTLPVKNKIRKTKRELSQKLKDHNQKTLNGYIKTSNITVTDINGDINTLETNKQTHKINRPTRERSIDRIENARNIQTYNSNLIDWRQQQGQYRLDISSKKRQRYELERKNKVVKNAQDGDSTALGKAKDAKLIAIKKSEDTLDLALDQLDILIDSTDLILKPLPITMKPDTSNFGFTIKNKKIILEMEDDIDQQINTPAVNAVMVPFEMKANDFMSTGYTKVAGDKLNRGKMTKALTLAMPTMIANDPFPKYENLSILNLAWIPFLIKSWGPSGAKSFGIPF